MTTHTSYWLSFFREAGLPDDICTKYAVLFSKERIDPSMLGEISKDILRDMGITAMGDIISILRHSRATLEKNTQDKTLEGMVRATPAGRTIAHYTGNSTRKDVVRLSGSKLADKKETETKPVEPLRRRVTPEIEGSYKVIMPKGTTPKTRAILQAMAESKKAKSKNESMVADKTARSVFERLAASAPAAAPAAAPTATAAAAPAREKLVRVADGSGAGSGSIFRRLGPRQASAAASASAPVTAATATTTATAATAGAKPGASPRLTEYAGVFKVVATGSKRRLVGGLTSAGAKRVRAEPGVVRAEATSTTQSEGIFAARRRPASVRDRLGGTRAAPGVKARLGRPTWS